VPAAPGEPPDSFRYYVNRRLQNRELLAHYSLRFILLHRRDIGSRARHCRMKQLAAEDGAAR
jgi:hypothetical protein